MKWFGILVLHGIVETSIKEYCKRDHPAGAFFFQVCGCSFDHDYSIFCPTKFVTFQGYVVVVATVQYAQYWILEPEQNHLFCDPACVWALVGRPRFLGVVLRFLVRVCERGSCFHHTRNSGTTSPLPVRSNVDSFSCFLSQKFAWLCDTTETASSVLYVFRMSELVCRRDTNPILFKFGDLSPVKCCNYVCTCCWRCCT
jgi:hypothetical protein